MLVLTKEFINGDQTGYYIETTDYEATPTTRKFIDKITKLEAKTDGEVRLKVINLISDIHQTITDPQLISLTRDVWNQISNRYDSYDHLSVDFGLWLFQKKFYIYANLWMRLVESRIDNIDWLVKAALSRHKRNDEAVDGLIFDALLPHINTYYDRKSILKAIFETTRITFNKFTRSDSSIIDQSGTEQDTYCKYFNFLIKHHKELNYPDFLNRLFRSSIGCGEDVEMEALRIIQKRGIDQVFIRTLPKSPKAQVKFVEIIAGPNGQWMQGDIAFDILGGCSACHDAWMKAIELKMSFDIMSIMEFQKKMPPLSVQETFFDYVELLKQPTKKVIKYLNKQEKLTPKYQKIVDLYNEIEDFM